MIALITPTGNRPKQFALCNLWMSRQTYKGKVLWIIVDDCVPITTKLSVELPDNWCVVYKYPRPEWEEGENTQSRNLQIGLNVVKNFPTTQIDAIFIIEDDDYYTPTYLEKMMDKFNGYEIIGECKTLYYNITSRSWHRNNNTKHASLFQTAFKPTAISMFEESFGKKFIDIKFFSTARELHKPVCLFSEMDLAVGIKGLPGRAGIGSGHKMTKKAIKDVKYTQLQKYLKNDYIYYL